MRHQRQRLQKVEMLVLKIIISYDFIYQNFDHEQLRQFSKFYEKLIPDILSLFPANFVSVG